MISSTLVSLCLLLGIVVTLWLALRQLERGILGTQSVVLVCALSSLVALGRVPFALFPGIQCATFIIILSGNVYGPRIGLYTGVLGTVIGNMFLGQGPWTLFQALAWGLCGLSSGLLLPKDCGRWLGAVWGIYWGILFGVITNIWHWFTFVYPHTFQTWVLVWAASIPFDAAHAISNAVLYFVFGSRMSQMFADFRIRFGLEN